MNQNQNFMSVAVLIAKEGKRIALKNALLKLVTPTLNEEGCLQYILFEDKNTHGIFYMREEFKNKKAFEFHIQTPYFKDFEKQIDMLMDKSIELIELEEVYDCE